MGTPERIGPWEILEPLGGGGNADVHLARDGEREVALKVLKTRNVESEPYARFRNEIDVLLRFQDDPGILPIVDASLPERPSKDDRAWIAMPRATLIREALEDATLREKVEAIATIAATLARLAEHGVAHRDLKPDNLYRYEDRWAVGDFGLARIPEETERRLTGSRLGPFGYMPDEFFADAMNADPFRADVFQLGKCLLVLASGLTDPPQGHIPAGSSGALSRYVADVQVAALDQIIDRCSRRDPDTRPTMVELVRELETWLSYEAPAGDPDLSAVITRFRETHRTALEAQDVRQEWARRFDEITRRIETTTLGWIEDRLGQAGMNPRMSSLHSHQEWLKRMQAMQIPETLLEAQRWVIGEFGDVGWPSEVAVGIGIEVDVNGQFWCTAHVAWGDMESTAGKDWTRADATAPIESIEVDAILEAVDGDVKAACAEMLRDLAEAEPD